MLLLFLQLPFRLIAQRHGLGQLNLLVRGEKRYLADLFQIHPDGIIDGEVIHQGVGVNQLLLFHLGNLRVGGLVVRQVRQQILIGADIDIQRFQRVIELIHLLAFQIQIIHSLHQLAGVQLALLLALAQQLPQLFIACDQRGGGQGSHDFVVQPVGGGSLLRLLDAVRLGGFFLLFVIVLFSGGVGCCQNGVRLSGQLLRGQFFFSHGAFLQYPLSFCIFP